MSAARRLADTIHAQLVTGTYQSVKKSSWDSFFAHYKKHAEDTFDVLSRETALRSIETFARVAKPKLIKAITTERVDRFIADRRKERATKKKLETDKLVSPATVNRELRYVRAALRLAEDWGYISKVPKFRFLKTHEKLPTYAPPEHFAAIMHACSAATLPNNLPNVSAPEWWRALLISLYMNGWRIKQMLNVRREDVNLTAMTVLSRAEHNKGRRYEEIPLHPFVAEYLKPLLGNFSELLLPWDHNRRTLWVEFGKIQQAAKLTDGTPLPKGGRTVAGMGSTI
ncbi:tyrosine-type recombinase/integrase [Schlesneria paludicola]|uniref:tyrosine-type recombinase/integrase n=1 Tax=Schlesneria paludicola TaxID=360056 RepID=UPI0012F740A2|nr:tyrosine-type recombinase/integrase [Schlesneria paludicola]